MAEKQRRKKEVGKVEAPQLQVISQADINDQIRSLFHSHQM